MLIVLNVLNLILDVFTMKVVNEIMI